MAHEYLTLADLVKVNDQNLADLEITDILNDAKLLAMLPAIEASNGNVHKYPVEDGAPTVGFRTINAGTENSKSSDRIATVDLEIVAASFDVDKALADIWKKGPEAYIQREARRHLRQALFNCEKQMIYGTDNNSDGYVGLVDNDVIKYADSELVLNATGSAADECSSVYFIRVTGEEGVATVISEGAQIDIGETVVIQKTDGDGKHYPAYYTPIEGWLGMQFGSKHDIGRIVNLSEEAGKGLTDALISKMIEKLPYDPTHILMSRRSRGQMQRSRTATNATGTEAPRPMDWEGIPIVELRSISDTEAVVAAAP